MFLVKFFDDVYHVALDNLLYDANLYSELIPRHQRNLIGKLMVSSSKLDENVWNLVNYTNLDSIS